MTTIELDAKKIEIFRMILDVKNEDVLREIEELLYGMNDLSDNSSYYSLKILHEAIMRSEEDFRTGQTHSMEEVRKRFPIL
ncbi:MAG: hypothetical protein FWF53_08915 [Candidatus Azobacteroides sp.]|nr:hypothetical protein [Candidatus Azobacteroides sp.]